MTEGIYGIYGTEVTNGDQADIRKAIGVNRKKDQLTDKTKLFAIRIIRLYQHLTDEKKEFVLSKQILRSGTSIGANRTEAVYAFSDKAFLHKNEVALGECAETLYWLDLLHATGYMTTKQHTSISVDCEALLKLLITTVKSLKKKAGCDS